MRHEPKNSQLFLERAREMRRQPSNAEATVWCALRGRKLRGLKFRRQQPLGIYIADFYCTEAKLVIELDGRTHAEKQKYDAQRDTWMDSEGIRVMRVTNREVEESLDAFLETAWWICTERIAEIARAAPSP